MNRYIYYRVPLRHTAALQQRVQALQGQLARETGVCGELLRRGEAEGEVLTWMEVYRNIPAGFDAALQLAEHQHDLAVLIVGKRYVDDFEPVPPPSC